MTRLRPWIGKALLVSYYAAGVAAPLMFVAGLGVAMGQGPDTLHARWWLWFAGWGLAIGTFGCPLLAVLHEWVSPRTATEDGARPSAVGFDTAGTTQRGPE